MAALLPFEIVENIVEYLDFEDVRSIARVCSAFQLPARLRLFRTIRIISNAHNTYPTPNHPILSSLHLLQYSSCFLVSCIGSMQQAPIYSLWSHLPTMYHLRNMEISLTPNDCSRALYALERFGSAREIALSLGCDLAPDLLISDNPLPVHSLRLHVDPSTHQVATRIVQKCSQSLQKLSLLLKDETTTLLPFLPHLCEFSLQTSLFELEDPNLMLWFPFLYQHPTITRISLDPTFTLAMQPPPNLLPNLQSLEAHPAIIERLIPGRRVNCITTECHFYETTDDFPDDILLRPLRQSVVPVTTFAIKTCTYFPNDILINIVQTLPQLRKFSFDWFCHEV